MFDFYGGSIKCFIILILGVINVCYIFLILGFIFKFEGRVGVGGDIVCNIFIKCE